MPKPARPVKGEQPPTDPTPGHVPSASQASWSTSDPEATRGFAIELARLAGDDKCENVLLLDVRELSHVTDYILIATGTSERQMRSVVEHLAELGAARGFPVFRSSEDDHSSWLLADFVDIVAHLFDHATRAHYDLEMLWGDAPRLDWQRPESIGRNRAGLRIGEPLPEGD
jgi:ribosome-associated protein